MIEDRWTGRAALAVMGWPFNLPLVWRRAWIVGFPITLPLWIVGVMVVAMPLIMIDIFWDLMTEMWN